MKALKLLIVASPNKIVSISPKEVLSKEYDLRDIIVKKDNVYIATVDGQIIKLTANLELVVKKNINMQKFMLWHLLIHYMQ